MNLMKRAVWVTARVLTHRWLDCVVPGVVFDWAWPRSKPYLRPGRIA